jgi:hypothetical protein
LTLFFLNSQSTRFSAHLLPLMLSRFFAADM